MPKHLRHVNSPGPGDQSKAVDDELEFHLAETVETLVERGWTEADARTEAERRFGDRQRYRRELEHVWRTPTGQRTASVRRVMILALLDSVRDTGRVLRKSPGFAATALLTVALGTGANTAVFSVIDAVLLRPLPYGQPEQLVAVSDTRASRPSQSLASGNLADYRLARSFDGIAGYNRISLSLTKSGLPEQVLGEAVTWNLFAVLGVSPALGRAFRPDEDRPGGEHVVILTHAFWATRFGADPAILGRVILLNDDPYVVIGVMPDGFQPLSQPGSGFTISFLVPAAYSDDVLANRRDFGISAVARLAPGVSIGEARAELRSISADLAQRVPATNRDVTADLAPLRDQFVHDVRLSLIVLLCAVGLVLLIACVNLANLLMVRAIGQRREIAIRIALGASRGQVALELALRGAWLGVLGGALGVLGGIWIREWLVSLAPASIPWLQQVALNPRVLAVTIGLSIVTGSVAGVLPAFQILRRDAAPTLRASALTTTGARALARWRGLLTAAEIASALMLTVGAGLLVRSLVQLTHVELGFRTGHVLTFMVRLPPARYRDQTTRLAFFEELERRVAPVPGVRSVAFADAFPMRGGWSSRIVIPGAGAADDVADFQVVSPGYFETLGMPLVRGRPLNDADRRGTSHAAVVSEAFVRRFFTGRDPIGRQFRRGDSMPDITVVGVVGDVRRDGRQGAIHPQVYVPAAQTDLYAQPLAEVAVHAAGDPYALLPAIQGIIWSIDADQPITHVQTFDEMVSRLMAGRQFNMMLLGALAALAVGLALVGVYGVVAHASAQRSKEIGIRIALGAQRRHVIALASASGVTWALTGMAVGLVGAYVGTRFMTGLLFGIPPTDALTFGVGAALTLGVACVASYLPARRAASSDPVSTLRTE